MDIAVVGVVAEVVGAVAVVVSLAYLAVQIRSNTREVKTENVHRVTDSFNVLNLTLAADEELAALWHKGSASYEDLGDTEKARFNFMWLSAFRIYDSLYYQIQRGTGDETLWQTELETLKWLFSSPGTREWWRQQQFTFSPGFKEFIDQHVLKANETTAT